MSLAVIIAETNADYEAFCALTLASGTEEVTEFKRLTNENCSKIGARRVLVLPKGFKSLSVGRAAAVRFNCAARGIQIYNVTLTKLAQLEALVAQEKEKAND